MTDGQPEWALIELRKLLDTSNLTQAEERLREATEHYDALPVPHRLVGNDEVTVARITVRAMKSGIDAIERKSIGHTDA